ncbi:hypothetical protein YZ35_05090 [Campylobacter lari]|uniref:hypothetical protein n=1 Tax=Campylobacter lari TaxID=201 RepID=UPI0013FEC009|nr:hypothetical protein [Campylobacter lari]EAI3912728.1 hypothetical protein [Campylobacter lari]EAI4812193.1 hypothetical protein [Campylobacter lari]EAI4841279.1 hypothetical protein [Campylobacter lari]EAI9743560.1 hypothetical protein [Campylobacter lari]EAK0953946.1 hypothetical protein [Campylobacter lari]
MSIPNLSIKIIRFLSDTYKNKTYIYGTLGIYLRIHFSVLNENSNIQDIFDVVKNIDANILNNFHKAIETEENLDQFSLKIRSSILTIICQEVNIPKNEIKKFLEHYKTNSN